MRTLICLLALLVTGWFCGQRVDAEQPIDIGTRLELFVDDHLIDRLDGSATQRLQLPEPKEVVLVTDKPWEGNTSAYYTIFRDGDLFRMYYRGSHWDEVNKKGTHREVTCYAESRDGIDWEKPELGLFEFDGSKANNIVWDGIGTHCFAVFKDENPSCSADARYKAIARGRPLGKKGLYLFKSPDGIHWTATSDGPVITEGAFDSQNLAFWDPHAEVYREYHRTFFNGVRSIMTGTSNDFVNWTEPTLLDLGDSPNQHLYTNAIKHYDRAPHLLIGFPTRFLPAEGDRVEPTLMTSRDGTRFHRWLQPVVPESAPKDRGGNRSNYMAWGVVDLPGDQDGVSVYATEAYYTGPDSRLRRFRYRKDGFVSVGADETGGELLTKLLRVSGTQLVVNAKTAAGGSVEVQIESADGKPLAVGEAFSGDDLSHHITWKSHDAIESVVNQPVRLRFKFSNAEVYAFQFGP